MGSPWLTRSRETTERAPATLRQVPWVLGCRSLSQMPWIWASAVCGALPDVGQGHWGPLHLQSAVQRPFPGTEVGCWPGNRICARAAQSCDAGALCRLRWELLCTGVFCPELVSGRRCGSAPASANAAAESDPASWKTSVPCSSGMPPSCGFSHSSRFRGVAPS